VTGQFFGHTHRDEVQVLYADKQLPIGEKQLPIGVAYIAPSVTPYSWMNPAYRYSITGIGVVG